MSAMVLHPMKHISLSAESGSSAIYDSCCAVLFGVFSEVVLIKGSDSWFLISISDGCAMMAMSEFQILISGFEVCVCRMLISISKEYYYAFSGQEVGGA